MLPAIAADNKPNAERTNGLMHPFVAVRTDIVQLLVR
ncbi:hypothetical protein LINGRAHAP2_LOCUS34406 [Linum grandiflorum]